jgi:predicted secreted hydrolase
MIKTILQNKKNHYRYLEALDITPKDDSFHGNINFIDVEWWYFDAVFDNDYSVHLGIRVYHIKNSGMIESRINIYRKGKIEVETTKKDFLNSFEITKNYPNIKINGKNVVEFEKEHYKKYGIWRYKIKLKINNNEADLTFEGTTKGWKIETDETCWTVALPKAKVDGKLTVRGKTLKVKGTGYHDHNWGYSPATMFKNIGWFWGRITGDALSITWAKTIQTPEKGDLLAVVNKDNNFGDNKNEFYSLKPDCIRFTPFNFSKDHRNSIPTEFDLKINSNLNDETKFSADIHMRSIYTQHSKIFTAHYWRYHVISSGYISLDNKKEELENKNQIMEFLLFKSLI